MLPAGFSKIKMSFKLRSSYLRFAVSQLTRWRGLPAPEICQFACHADFSHDLSFRDGVGRVCREPGLKPLLTCEHVCS